MVLGSIQIFPFSEITLDGPSATLHYHVHKVLNCIFESKNFESLLQKENYRVRKRKQPEKKRDREKRRSIEFIKAT